MFVNEIKECSFSKNKIKFENYKFLEIPESTIYILDINMFKKVNEYLFKANNLCCANFFKL